MAPSTNGAQGTAQVSNTFTTAISLAKGHNPSLLEGFYLMDLDKEFRKSMRAQKIGIKDLRFEWFGLAIPDSIKGSLTVFIQDSAGVETSRKVLLDSHAKNRAGKEKTTRGMFRLDSAGFKAFRNAIAGDTPRLELFFQLLSREGPIPTRAAVLKFSIGTSFEKAF